MAQQRATRLARIRAQYTGEQHTEALERVREHGPRAGIVPAAEDAEQQLLEARILHALAAAVGAHRPAEYGGPFGIVSVSPTPAGVLLRCAPARLQELLQALTPWNLGDGELSGRLGLRARLDEDGERLTFRHAQLNGAVTAVSAPAGGGGGRDALRAAVDAMPEPPSLFDAPEIFFEPGVDTAVDQRVRAEAGAWSTALRRLGLFGGADVVDFTSGPPPADALAGPHPGDLAPVGPDRGVDRSSRRYVLTPEVEAVLDGYGLRGIEYPNLWEWLYEGRTPRTYCDWCDRTVDARKEDTSVELVFTAYDPDLCPATEMLASKLFHAACKPSAVAWAVRADLPSSPTPFELTVEGHDDKPAQFRWVVRPVLLHDGPDDDAEDGPPADGGDEETAALVFVGQVLDPAGSPVRAWQDALSMHLREVGFDIAGGLAGSDGWAARLVTEGGRPWIAVRKPAGEDGSREHFWVGRIDPAPRWLEVARRDSHVLLVAGHDRIDGYGDWDGDGDDVGDDLDARVDAVHRALEELIDDGGILLAGAALVP